MLFPMYIDGKWCECEKKKQVINPATGESIGEIPMGGAEEVERAILAAERETRRMEEMTVFERAEMCVRIADAIEARKEEIAKILSQEHGKPYHTEALGEVGGSAASFREAAEQIKWMTSEMLQVREKDTRVLTYRRPRGVYVVISPWNFPLGNPTIYYLAPGLAAGNTIVWLPPVSSAAVASVYMKCFEDAKVPAGVINMVIGNPTDAKTPAVEHPKTAAIAFTGSTGVGNAIVAKAKAKPALMELGGNGPVIVFPDADLKKAADGIMMGAFSNAGQICTSTERVLVHDSVADELVKIMLSKVDKYKLGDPMDKDTVVGPVHESGVIKRFLSQIEEAVEKGAKILYGGGIASGFPTENFLQPTIIDHVPTDSMLNLDETFAPIVPLVRYKDEKELPGLIDASPYGLSMAIYSRNVDKAMKFAEKMKFGIVNLNAASAYWDWTFPAGGTGGRQSGYGRCGGKWSIEEMSELRTITVSLSGE